MKIDFRPASPEDFGYCATLYFDAMEPTIRALALDMDKHAADFRERWSAAEIRIIARDGADIGWLQTAVEADALFLKQLFVEAPLRHQGIGAHVMHRLIEEAARAGRAVTLGVVKTNPALRLYQRLGFAITHADERKLYMRREREPPGPTRG
ncbi:MAG TPA: GNAT family N-acetyltransferase [Alphaproteobacteria bacterium]|nr:GNAT family N-acetyltransferase [Alphaproteobacteria bacterium]